MRIAAATVLILMLLTSGAQAATCFVYDALGRIVEATYENGTKFTYIYDANGNRVASSTASGQTPSCSDPGGFGPNTPPQANADSTTARPTVGKTINVRANDTDADGDVLTIASVTAPAKGTAVIQGGNVVYTANNGTSGTDSFSYSVTDSRGGSATATVSITSIVANSAPVAAGDSASVAPGGSSTLSVRANDSDADGDTLTITVVSTPTKGTASIVNGAVLYTANAAATGSDSFYYTVIDGFGGSATATVTITFNRLPVAVADSAGASPGGSAITINVRANDSDPDGDTLSVVGTTTPTKGTVTLSNNNLVYSANANASGTDTFTYTISDGRGGSASATVTVTVAPNRPPVAVADSAYRSATTTSAMWVTLDPRFNDSDPDNDTLTITSVTQGTFGSVTILNGGTTVKYQRTSNYPSSGNVGSDSFTYTVSDGRGGTASATVGVQIERYGGGCSGTCL